MFARSNRSPSGHDCPMSARGGAVLYTPEILALAVELAEFPYHDMHPRRGEARSRVCGSRVTLSIETDERGRISALGSRVSACAIGQAAAALFLRGAMDRDAVGISAALAKLERWLDGDDAEPDWPGIAVLASARPYPARHQAILLPWKAALAALSNRAASD